MTMSEQKTMPETILIRVARGAKLLDTVNPGWAGRIALDTLTMESCDRCILGQLYGNYWNGCRMLVSPSWETSRASASASVYGFTLPNDSQRSDDADSEAAVTARFAALGAAWRAEVRTRTEATP